MTSFSNAEEAAIGLTDVVPFPLETKLVEQGAVFEAAGLFQEKVVVDGRLITGQNPASATVRGPSLGVAHHDVFGGLLPLART